jgi:hypothetical protein
MQASLQNDNPLLMLLSMDEVVIHVYNETAFLIVLSQLLNKYCALTMNVVKASSQPSTTRHDVQKKDHQ